MTGIRVHGWTVPGGLSEAAEPLPDAEIEQTRWMNGVDVVNVFGRLYAPREADQVARVIQSAAAQAAAHNLGATA